MANPSFAKSTYKLQNTIVRELNNAHIFLEQIVPVLDDAKTTYSKSKSRKEKRYYVPSTKKGKFAKRTDVELKVIYDQYLNSGLYVNRPGFCRHLGTMENGLKRGVYE